MGFWSWLFGSKAAPEAPVDEWKPTPMGVRSGSSFPKQGRREHRIHGDGEFSFDIVGESYYQSNLLTIAGPKTEDGVEIECTARLVPEPDNPHDKNAVSVQINGLKVGHLSRVDALSWNIAAERQGMHGDVVEVDAIIVGGWKRANGDEGHFGVKLDL